MKHNVKLTEDEAARLEAMAREKNMKPEAVIESAVNEFCAESPHQDTSCSTALLTVHHVMRVLRIKRTTLDKLVRLGRVGDPAGIKSLRIGGRLLRFRPKDLHDYVNRQGGGVS